MAKRAERARRLTSAMTAPPRADHKQLCDYGSAWVSRPGSTNVRCATRHCRAAGLSQLSPGLLPHCHRSGCGTKRRLWKQRATYDAAVLPLRQSNRKQLMVLIAAASDRGAGVMLAPVSPTPGSCGMSSHPCRAYLGLTAARG